MLEGYETMMAQMDYGPEVHEVPEVYEVPEVHKLSPSYATIQVPHLKHDDKEHPNLSASLVGDHFRKGPINKQKLVEEKVVVDPDEPMTVQGHKHITTQRELDEAFKLDRKIEKDMNTLVGKLLKKEYIDNWIDVLWALGSIRGPGPTASGVGTLANPDIIRSLGKAILNKNDINPLDILELQGEKHTYILK